MIKRAIVRHTNFIAPYNRPWEYTSDFNAINLRAWSSQISKHWKKFSDLLNMQTERIDEKLQNANWTVSLLDIKIFSHLSIYLIFLDLPYSSILSV